MKITCDMHTHTVFCDGKNTPEEMVLSALEKGCTTLGFSGHAYADITNSDVWWMNFEEQLEYASQITELKSKYHGKIKILLGAEVDYFSKPLNFKCDYTIGSVHALKIGDEFCDVDNTPELLKDAIDNYFDGNSLKLAKAYFSMEADIVNKTDCDIIGHFDLLTKFNEKYFIFDTSSKEYRSSALDALDALIEKNRIFEINTGAMSRGWRTSPYPQDFILKRLAEKNATVMLTSDSHSKENIMYAFDEAEQYARSCGIKRFFQY